jgi:hypothetical protein
MNDQSPSADTVASAPAPAYQLSYEQRLTHDLERLLRYASTAKSIEVPKDVLQDAAHALQAAKSQIGELRPLATDAEVALFKAIDALSPRVYPATTASLEIAELMEAGSVGGSDRQMEIRRRVKSLIRNWIYVTVICLLFVFLTLLGKKLTPVPDLALVIYFCSFVNPIVLGCLGSCAFILRSILQGLASQTFVLRDGTTYTLRFILGAILGFMIPGLMADNVQTLGFLSAIAVPFLAGYAVEPMFAALDNLVLTIRDAVSRSPTPRATTPK